MNGLRALRLAALDLWEESLVLLGAGLIGGLFSLLLVPLPFVLAAHYGVAERIPEARVISWRIWLQHGREHAPFAYKWALLVATVSALFLASIYFYLRLDAAWAQVTGWTLANLLLLWLLPQPFVPALYLQQTDRRLRVALRNAVVLAISDWPATFLLWGSTLLLAFPLAYVAWPLLPLLQVWIVLVSTRVVWLHLKRLSG